MQPAQWAKGVAFRNLFHELGRICDVSPVDQISGELSLHLLSSGPVTDDEIASQIAGVVRRYEAQDVTVFYDFKIVCWTAAPRPTALVQSAEHAAKLKQLTQQKLTESSKLTRSNDRLSCCGQAWLSQTAVRPEATIVIRRSVEQDSPGLSIDRLDPMDFSDQISRDR